MARVKKVLIANLASPANPGDQAILKGSMKVCSEILGRAEYTIATRAYSERQTYEKWGCRVVPSFPNVEPIGMDDSLGKWKKIPMTLLEGRFLKEAVRESDIVLLAGGAYFYSYRPLIPGFTFLAHISPVYWAKKFGKPVVMLPQSYGPFTSNAARSLFKYAGRSSEKILYREEISGDYLKKEFEGKGALCAFMPDHALYLEKEDLVSETAARRKRLLGVTLRPWKENGRDETSYVNELEETLVWYADALDGRIRIIVQVQDQKRSEGDEAVSLRLKERLEKRLGTDKVEFFTKKPFFELADLCRLYYECDLMLSMRLHSALLSFVVGTPALVIGYQHKAEGILRSLGLADLYMGSFKDAKADVLKSALERLAAERGLNARKIETALSLARGKIQNGMKEILL